VGHAKKVGAETNHHVTKLREFTFQARQVMDTVIDNLARAIRKLAAAGTNILC
jgi:hydroxypyruvate isomerase